MAPMALNLLSNSVPGILGKAFQRKYIALGRIVTNWTEIIGPDFAERAQPAKIHYRKPKTPKGKPEATLEIAASSADCAVLVYQKDLILERINRIFGDRWISDIKYVHLEPKISKKPPRRMKSLTLDEKNHLSQMLETVDDPELKERLSRLGEALMQEKKK
jgi:hypothetical protein